VQRRCFDWLGGTRNVVLLNKEVSHVPSRCCSPPSRIPLAKSLTQQSPVLQLDQLWQHLPAPHRQAIGVTLAEMIARQIEAFPSSLRQKEENDD